MKFDRPQGFGGSRPRNWIDKNLPHCPFCKAVSLWELAQTVGLTPASTRYYFRCPDCLAILSVPAASIMGFSPAGLAMFLMASKKVRIESFGTNDKLAKLIGKECSIEVLRKGIPSRK